MTTKWVDANWTGPSGEPGDMEVGDVGFLVTISNVLKGTSYSVLRATPQLTNSSREERLKGWCGTTNDQHVQAVGLAKVCRVTDGNFRDFTGPRAQVRLLNEDATLEALEALGYEHLAP